MLIQYKQLQLHVFDTEGIWIIKPIYPYFKFRAGDVMFEIYAN